MIYLSTGANGAGKTLLTLKDVRAQQLKENRPVYFHGFEAGDKITGEFGWLPFEPAKWQDLPDGSICVFDECQNEMGAKSFAQGVPDWINAMAQFRRKRGFDFWMITPHPSMLHVNVRRLIGDPSWHRHLKRAFGADVVSVIKYTAPNLRCDEAGAGRDAEVSMVPYPKEVYSWYRSASLHTGKKKIPRAVWFMLAAVVLVPTLAYLAFSTFTGANEKRAQVIASKAGGKSSGSSSGSSVSSGGSSGYGKPSGQLTAADYIAARKPRIEGFQHTAPAFDSITAPAHAPYPAACLDGTRPGTKQRSCECYTQQGTRLPVPLSTCEQIVRNGFFIEWHHEQARAVSPVAPLAAQPVEVNAPPVVIGTPRRPAPLAASPASAPRG